MTPRDHAALFASRVAALPDLVEDYLGRSDPPPIDGEGALVTTGIGSSEAPARRCAAVLARAGRQATFAPLSAFASGTAPAGDELIVFSQGLSPNAMLAVRGARATFRRALLFTSILPGSPLAAERGLDAAIGEGVEAVLLPPASEDGILPRIVGPVIASLAAFRAARPLAPSLLPDLRALDLPGAMRRAGAEAPLDLDALGERDVAFVTAGDHGELSRGAVNAWLEGLRAGAPQVWDVLGFAHGGLQSRASRPPLLFALERAAVEGEGPLFDRLERVVRSPRAIVRLAARLPPLLAWLEHEVAVLEVVSRELEARPRDLGWGPGREDQPLYELGAHPPPDH